MRRCKTPPMQVTQLPRDEIARRIRAARELRGKSQAALAALMVDDGLNKHDLGKIEREKMQMRRAHQDSIQRHLEIPERWLTAESVDEIVNAAPFEVSTDGRLDQIEEQLGQLIGAVGLDGSRRADLSDQIVRTVEKALSQRATEVGRRPTGHGLSTGHPGQGQEGVA